MDSVHGRRYDVLNHMGYGPIIEDYNKAIVHLPKLH